MNLFHTEAKRVSSIYVKCVRRINSQHFQMSLLSAAGSSFNTLFASRKFCCGQCFFFVPHPSPLQKNSSVVWDSRSYLQVRERLLKNNHPFSSVGYPPIPQGSLGTIGVVVGRGGDFGSSGRSGSFKNSHSVAVSSPRQPPSTRSWHLQRCTGSILFPRVTLDALENLHRPHCFSGRACLPHSSPIWVPD